MIDLLFANAVDTIIMMNQVKQPSMLRRIIKAPFIAGFILLLYLLGTSCLQRVKGFAPAFGWSATTVRVLEIILIAFFAFISILIALKLFTSED